MSPESGHRTSLGGFFLGLVQKNVMLKLLSVVLAFGFWAWVKADQVVEMKGRVEVDSAWLDTRSASYQDVRFASPAHPCV